MVDADMNIEYTMNTCQGTLLIVSKRTHNLAYNLCADRAFCVISTLAGSLRHTGSAVCALWVNIVKTLAEFEAREYANAFCKGWGGRLYESQWLTTYEGKPRVKAGDEGDGTSEHGCHDCGCLIGEYHVPGCDMERCPICGEQVITCGCVEEVAI